MFFFKLFSFKAVQGIWAKELEDATCAAINHKYRLLAFGRQKYKHIDISFIWYKLLSFPFSSEGIVMMVDEATGGLEICHRLTLSSKDFSGQPGRVCKFQFFK